MLGCIQPMSSPMIKRMFGLCSWARAGGPVTIMAASPAMRPKRVRLILMVRLLSVLCCRHAASFNGGCSRHLMAGVSGHLNLPCKHGGSAPPLIIVAEPAVRIVQCDLPVHSAVLLWEPHGILNWALAQGCNSYNELL